MGNIVCFRDLENATEDAIKTFDDENSVNIILEKSYEEYMEGFTDKEWQSSCWRRKVERRGISFYQ